MNASFSISGNVVNVSDRTVRCGTVYVADGLIERIELDDSDAIDPDAMYLMPGFIDSHIHIESSMLLPAAFAQAAVVHGTVATVSDPHEIANVCGMEGIELMLQNAAQTRFKFHFGAPACVPATPFETAGAQLDVAATERLLNLPDIGYLSEMMDFPGVLNRSDAVMAKIQAAKARGKPVDGHAPGLRGPEAEKYFGAGISTDHECFTLEEGLDKLKAGCTIAIREGSAARNFAALWPLIDSHTNNVMLCSDDKHPDELLLGHINQLAARAIALGCDLMNVLQVACVNPVRHYGINVGLLQVGDPADFIVVRDLQKFHVIETYLDGHKVAQNGQSLMPIVDAEPLNRFVARPIQSSQLRVPASTDRIRVIRALDGQLITLADVRDAVKVEGMAVADPGQDLLKMVVVNRYQPAEPAVAFVAGFGLKSGAFASSVAHDSHNIVAVGASDEELARSINLVIQQQGGLSVVDADFSAVLPLPIAGLMSTATCAEAGDQYSQLDARVKELGCPLRAPYMTLSFMALLVIPSLKLSDRGLFDVDKFEFTSLFV